MRYVVGTFRNVGLEARWTRTRTGAPIIAARIPGSRPWYAVDDRMWRQIVAEGEVRQTFERCTLIADLFGVEA